MPQALPNKIFLLLFSASAILAACSAGQPSEPASTELGVSDIQIAVASDDFPVGQSRLPLVLYAGTERGADAQAVHLTALDLSKDPSEKGWEGNAKEFTDYWIPYWVAYPDLPHTGNWGFIADITLTDGSTTRAQFAIQVSEKGNAPAVGSQPPASQNRTLASEPDIHKLSSAVDPDPGLYQMTVADALKSGKPSVVTFATPGYCTSQLCAPVVDTVDAVYKQYQDQANFIHIEVYKTFDPLVYADEMAEWGLTSEPWTFVLDKDGKVSARFNGPLGKEELVSALEPLLP